MPRTRYCFSDFKGPYFVIGSRRSVALRILHACDGVPLVQDGAEVSVVVLHGSAPAAGEYRVRIPLTTYTCGYLQAEYTLHCAPLSVVTRLE